jgi:PTH1 family peptidyl-tRNA hydrolase
MALFQKKLDSTDGSSLYTVGMSKNVLIVGLGNPGKRYEGTRHNIGFEILDNFAKKNDFNAWIVKKDLKCEVATATMGSTRVILCKPTTFMNNGGEAASAIQRFYRVYNPGTLAVYDELAIPFGNLRTRVGGSDAGHNGVKSLIAYLGEDFNRLRIGTGNEISIKADASDFVLGKFTKKEQETVPLILREAAAIITEFIFGGELPHDARTIF